MKTLENHTIYYDTDCPMCDVYTGAMVKTGMLGAEGRAGYCPQACAAHPTIDAKRARNEIALIDNTTNEVQYGIDSIITVLTAGAPWLAPILKFKPIRWFATKCYRFISYNRKVIAPPKIFEAEASCTPDLNLRYRIAYLIGTWILTAAVLTAYTDTLMAFIPHTTGWRELAICGGQMVWQGAFLALIFPKRIIHYLGNMMTISAGGAIALLPILALNQLFELPGIINLGYFAVVVLFMFIEHIRRVKYLELPWVTTLSWALYRIVVLTIILNF